jgi:hypothetical protein
MLEKNHRFDLLRLCGFTFLALVVGVSAAAGKPGTREKVVAAPGWKYRVAAQNLPGVDNLVISADGSLYATQELPRGAGKVIHRHGAGGFGTGPTGRPAVAR